jgi:signal transduction histidine kinase
MDQSSQFNYKSALQPASQFEDGGQMGQMIRNYPWDAHPLGNPVHWPLSLKTGIRIMLHSKHPIFIWWTKEMYMFHNDAYVPLMGQKHPEGLGAKGYEVWAETWPQLGAILEGILKGDEAFYGEELEVHMNRKGFMDETFWTFSYSAMPDDEGKVNGIFCACNDVTQSVLAKRRLKINKDLSDAIVGQPTLVQACEKACQVMGHSTSDIPFSLMYLLEEGTSEVRMAASSGNLPAGVMLASLQLTITDGQSPWPLRQVYEQQVPVVVDLPMQAFSADLRPSRAVILPIPKAGEKLLHGFLIVGLSRRLAYDEVYQDFHHMLVGQIATALSAVQARGQAEQQRRRLHDLFMQAPAPICILDGETLVYQLVNPAYAQLFPGRSLLGRRILEALPEIAENRVWETLQKVYQTGRTHEEKEIFIPIRNQEGMPENRYFRYIQQARYDLSGRIDGVVVFALEITDQVVARQKIEQSQKQLQQLNDELALTNRELAIANEQVQASNTELSESNRQLSRTNTDLDNFVYTASHDLKAPILNIEGLLKNMERLLGNQLKENIPIQRIYAMLYDSVNRFKSTISDLTQVIRVSKEAPEDIATISIEEVLSEVIEDLKPQMEEANVSLSVHLNGCRFVNFSRHNLKSIFYNLLSNAIKYRSPQRQAIVSISCQQEGDYTKITVEDNGLGIDMNQQDKIFAIFKRLHTHVEGTGIGLYIVKKMIENAGGSIEVESKVGVGSVFRVYFKS